jgi:hypothetical protein
MEMTLLEEIIHKTSSMKQIASGRSGAYTVALYKRTTGAGTTKYYEWRQMFRSDSGPAVANIFGEITEDRATEIMANRIESVEVL